MIINHNIENIPKSSLVFCKLFLYCSNHNNSVLENGNFNMDCSTLFPVNIVIINNDCRGHLITAFPIRVAIKNSLNGIK